MFGVGETGMEETGKLRVRWGGAGPKQGELLRPSREFGSFPRGSAVNLPARQETRLQSLGQEDPLEKGMATHSSVLAWTIPGTEEPGELQSVGSQRVKHD